MRKSNEQSLKEVISDFLEKNRLREGFNEQKIVQSWARIMGPVIAKRTTDIFIRNKKLFIRLSSAALKQEFLYSKEKILAMINEEAGNEAVLDIVLL